MTVTITILIDAAYALAVCGAALIFPPLALAVAAAFLIGQAVLADRRSTPEASE